MTVPASSYNPLIPQPTDQQNNSQSDLLNNFGALTSWIDQDHVDSAQAGAGKHFRVTLPVQASDPTFTGTDTGFFNALYTTTGLQEVTIHKLLAGGTPANIPMTASVLSEDLAPDPLSVGWTLLPSGIVMIWGTASGTGLTTITVPTLTENSSAVPFLNAILIVLFTSNTTGALITLNSILSSTQYQVNVASTSGSAIAGNFSYLIIGR